MPRTLRGLIGDVLQLLALGLRSHTHLAAGNLFLRKQLTFNGDQPRRLDDATRLTPVVLARLIEGRRLLAVQPETLLRWHRRRTVARAGHFRVASNGSTGRRLPHGHCVAAVPILGGLHHEYRPESDAA